MLRRRTTFATPFVMTTACWSSSAPPPVVEPQPVVPDARVESEPEPPVAIVEPLVVSKIVPDGALVVQPRVDGPCYLVYERKLGGRSSRTQFDEGAVECPPTGPNVKLPAKLYVRVKDTPYRLDPESLQCSHEVRGNPPGWQATPCPAQLLPEAIGITPDANCVYRGVTVLAPSCTPRVAPGTIARARIISAMQGTNSVEVTVGAGRREGLDVGMTLRIDGVGSAKVSACTDRMCKATFAATLAQITTASYAIVED